MPYTIRTNSWLLTLKTLTPVQRKSKARPRNARDTRSRECPNSVENKLIEDGEDLKKKKILQKKARANAKVLDKLISQDVEIMQNQESILNEQTDF